MRSMICAALAMCLTAAVSAQEGKSLFNGKDLTGWEGNPDIWSVQDGVLVGQTTAEKPTKGNTFLIYKGGTLKDFELRLLFKVESGNSGVQYRSKHYDDAKQANKWVVGGYQADMDTANTYTGMLYEERGRGIVCLPGRKVTLEAGQKPKMEQITDPAAIKATIKKGEWNELVITAKGNHLVHKLNGLVSADITDNDEAKRAMEGILALQVHAGPPMKVMFKEITLKETK